jgi:hypothetical protein
MKIIVFDLDETLGYFTEFGIFWDCLVYYFKRINKKLDQSDFNNILHLFPEFIRPNIINILLFLKENKKLNRCHKLMIYTNNQGPKEWTHKIINYFEKCIKYKLFDQIIAAFKIKGEKIELCRSSHNKCHQDFIKCTEIPDNAEICFLDDNYFPEMVNDNVYYINVKPYYFDLHIKEMISRFINSRLYQKYIENIEFEEFMLQYFKKYNYTYLKKTKQEHEIDKILGKKIQKHIHFFLKRNEESPKTKKNKTSKNKTHKSR